MRNGKVMQMWGMTELFMGLNTRLDDAEGVRCGCVGRPTPEMEVRIVDDAGHPIANSDSGELQIRGPSVFAGYYDNAEVNDGAFVDGWFRTGDLACRDSEGNFQITGRLKDLINRGGIKINPIDVEVLSRASREEVTDDEVALRLLALPGVGPYAAAHVMMLIGRYSRLILDSWTRPKYRRVSGRPRITDKGIERAFRRYRQFAGLAFWLMLTEDWLPAE